MLTLPPERRFGNQRSAEERWQSPYLSLNSGELEERGNQGRDRYDDERGTPARLTKRWWRAPRRLCANRPWAFRRRGPKSPRYCALVSFTNRRFMARQFCGSFGRTFTTCSPGLLISTWPRLSSLNWSHPAVWPALPLICWPASSTTNSDSPETHA